MILMHLCESLIATKLMDEVRKKSPQMLKGLEEAVEYIKKLSNIADEDLEHQNRNETGNHSTL